MRVTWFFVAWSRSMQNNLFNKNILLAPGRGLSIKHSWLIIVKLSMHHQLTCTLINCWIFRIKHFYSFTMINQKWFKRWLRKSHWVFSHHDVIKLLTNQTAISWQWTLTKSFYAEENKLISCFLNAPSSIVF